MVQTNHAFIAALLLATIGVTGAASGHCTLTGGETVRNGWSGKDTGSNSCNSCSCADEGLSCTEMFCLDASTDSKSKTCTLNAGEVVESGWRGKDTGSNACNSCSCSDGLLACTRMACARRAAASETCTLTGGEVVQSGWSGKDTGSNYCNSCSCSGEGLACTEMGCEPTATTTTVATTTAAKMCKLSGGEVVPSGWSGKDTGANYCNSCRCGNGMMACTLMMCPPTTSAGETTTVTTTKSASENATCTLSDGITKVAVGWSGKDAGANYCNSCRCSSRGLACTKMLCQRRSTTTAAGSTCTLTGGEVVQSGWAGKDTGSNHCNSCSCSDAGLMCTEMGCMPLESTTATTTAAKMCKLTGGEMVQSGWAGKDTGSNYCNSCRCGNGMMACTRMKCPPTTAEPTTVTTTKAGSIKAMCTLSDGSTKVADGWSGQDTGSNHCNSCRCSDGALACTEMGCGPIEAVEETALSTTATTTTAKTCKLSGGEVVPSGWSGKDTGANYCNSCRCGNGMMACTLMMCPPTTSAGETTTVTTTKSATCTLSDGVTKVAAGWSGKDAGSNYCNSCRCANGTLACTKKRCQSRSTTAAASGRTCTLTGGEVVLSGWSGMDTGSNYCNSCGCSDGSLECDEEACVAVPSTTVTTTTAKMCKLTGGELVSSGWSGKDTGDNYCNSCSCRNGMMACTLMMCPPRSTAETTTRTTTKAASMNVMCTLSDGITKVAAGWSGKDLGNNWCNSCSCTERGAMICTMMFCMDDLQVVQV